MAILFIIPLTACFGEDYDVGVPTAHLQTDIGLHTLTKPLTEANITWNSSSGNVTETVKDIKQFGVSQKEIVVASNQELHLNFEENVENGGDIWTEPTITASLWHKGEHIPVTLNDSLEFYLPVEDGQYVLEVNFKNSSNSAQYVGNIIVEKPTAQSNIVGDVLKDFTMMEPPAITKEDNKGVQSSSFDNSYSEVCWNNCTSNRTYNYHDVHFGNVEIGNNIVVDWNTMYPKPTEINLLQLNKENYSVIREEYVDSKKTSLKMEVDEHSIGHLYGVEFKWKQGDAIKGISILQFELN